MEETIFRKPLWISQGWAYSICSPDATQVPDTLEHFYIIQANGVFKAICGAIAYAVTDECGASAYFCDKCFEMTGKRSEKQSYDSK